MQTQQRNLIHFTIITLIVVALLAIASTITVLYNAAIRFHSQRLSATADSITQLLAFSAESDTSLDGEEIKHIILNHHMNEGLGTTGKIIIARQNGDRLQFLVNIPEPHATDATPKATGQQEQALRRALSGMTGVMNDVDYHGRSVLSAYHPIPSLGLGLVVRMDLNEIRQPFFGAAIGAGVIVLSILLLVPLIYTRLSSPLFKELSDEQNRYRALIELSPYGVLVLDTQNGDFLTFNRIAHEQLGYTAEEFRQLHLADIEATVPPRAFQERTAKVLESGYDEFDTLHRTKSGELRNIHVHIKTFKYGGHLSFHTIFRDITEQVKSREELLRYREHLEELVDERSEELLEINHQLEREIGERIAAEAQLKLSEIVYRNTLEGVFVTDANGTILAVNPAFSQITGYRSEDVVGQNPRILKSKLQSREFYRDLWDTLIQSGQWKGEIWNRRKNGEAYLQQLTITMNPGSNGKPLNYVAVFSDITTLREKEQRIHHQAYHDALTGLPNRLLFQDRLKQALLLAERNKHPLAVMFLDLDRFKVINDTLGHHIGDDLLRMVAVRLSDLLRQSDTVSRFGGDEFVILISEADSVNAIEEVAEKVIAMFLTPFSTEAHELLLTTSIGIALFPDDGSDAPTLMKNADAAMYHAKESGRNNFKFYAAEMNARAAQRLALEQRLRKGLENNAFELYYQPRVILENQAIIGAEALIRWNDPEHGQISSADFIPVAEECGIIVPLGEWVLEQACIQAREWHEQGYPIRVSVNISARQFSSTALTTLVARLLDKTGLPGNSLELELTETLIMSHAEQTIDTLRELKKLGVWIAVDDFGTGYSSLSYLKRFPIDTLKIDQSFIQDITTDSNDAAIVETIIALGRSLDIEVLAEGVETAQQLEFLRMRGCNLIQGYYFSEPVPAGQMTTLLKKHYEPAGQP